MRVLPGRGRRPPVNRRLNITWGESLEKMLLKQCDRTRDGERGESLYLQQPLRPARRIRPDPPAAFPRAIDLLSRSVSSRLEEEPMRSLAASLGPHVQSMLYVGPPDSLAPCHWDALDNLFVQVCNHLLLSWNHRFLSCSSHLFLSCSNRFLPCNRPPRADLRCEARAALRARRGGHAPLPGEPPFRLALAGVEARPVCNNRVLPRHHDVTTV